ncbi:MAG: RpiB/LacA/LacB family sugar-phosphate isomerase [Patescibacteria group bacterium]
MIYIASDHTGFELKDGLKEYLLLRGYKVSDIGPEKDMHIDYPDYALDVASKVSKEFNSRGILVSGTGQGMCITANKVKNISAALVFNEDVAEKTRLEDNSNIICLPSENLSLELAKRIVSTWLSTSFSGVEYCNNCIKKIRKIEEKK